MNNKNNNYRVMKFLEPVNKSDKCKGYVRLDMRGVRGTIIVSVENVGDCKSLSEVYLYKDKINKLKIGTVNNKKGMIKKSISIGNNDIKLEDYNVCGVVKDSKIVLYANLFNPVNSNDITKLEETIHATIVEEDIHEDEKNTEENSETYLEDEIKEKEDIDCKIDQVEAAPESESEIENNNEIDNEINEVEKTEKEEEPQLESASKKKAHVNQFEENLYEVLKEYKKLDPLSVNIKSISWWKIPYDDRGVKNGSLPYYNQIISSYYPYPLSNRVTTCSGLMRKYGYYIFGVYKENEDIKKLVYGVPGEFKRDEQPYKGVTGFKNWSYKNNEIKGDHGFWLAFVNSSTGEVTEPPQIVLGK